MSSSNILTFCSNDINVIRENFWEAIVSNIDHITVLLLLRALFVNNLLLIAW